MICAVNKNEEKEKREMLRSIINLLGALFIFLRTADVMCDVSFAERGGIRGRNAASSPGLRSLLSSVNSFMTVVLASVAAERFQTLI
jgi:hypothetical protein